MPEHSNNIDKFYSDLAVFENCIAQAFVRGRDGSHEREIDRPSRLNTIYSAFA